MSQQPFTSNVLVDAVICLARKGRRVALDREPSRFAAGCLARSHRPFPERLGLPTRCGRGPSALRAEAALRYGLAKKRALFDARR